MVVLMIGPDKPIDTNKYFVICSCSWGCVERQVLMILILIPQNIGLDFPTITIRDM